MQITKSNNYIVLKPTEGSIIVFFNNFESRYSEFKSEHIIIDFSEIFNTKIKELMLFLNISVKQKENGTSFVLISEGIDIDSIPDEINVVPTFTEAIDILEMDAIERDLGF